MAEAGSGQGPGAPLGPNSPTSAAPSADGRPRTALRRLPKRGVDDREAIEAILDQALLAHLGTVEAGGYPVVIPTLHARSGGFVYLHGSAASRSLRRAGEAGAEVCLTVTLIDGLVLARSAMHHSVNYRSVVVFGAAQWVTEPAEKARALEAFTEKLIPGRWADVRPPSERELRATGVLRLSLAEASAKVRSGPPLDDEDDYRLAVWAGTVELRTVAGEPRPDERLAAGVECPDYVRALSG